MVLNILFISGDDRFTLDMIGFNIESSLEDCNIGIFKAEDEGDILYHLDHDDIHLIVADMNIETIESYEFYDKLQQDIKYRDIPFVFLSSNEEDQDIAILKGISNFFLKPLDVDQLLETLHNILKNAKSKQENTSLPDGYSLDDDSYSSEDISLENITNYSNQIEELLDNTMTNKDQIKQLTLKIKEEVEKISTVSTNHTYSF